MGTILKPEWGFPGCILVAIASSASHCLEPGPDLTLSPRRGYLGASLAPTHFRPSWVPLGGTSSFSSSASSSSSPSLSGIGLGEPSEHRQWNAQAAVCLQPAGRPGPPQEEEEEQQEKEEEEEDKDNDKLKE